MITLRIDCIEKAVQDKLARLFKIADKAELYCNSFFNF